MVILNKKGAKAPYLKLIIMASILDNAETYMVDLPLFSKLGFKSFSTGVHGERYVGEYKLPDYETGSIKVWVTCMPAMFWRFEILTIEGKHFSANHGFRSASKLLAQRDAGC